MDNYPVRSHANLINTFLASQACSLSLQLGFLRFEDFAYFFDTDLTAPDETDLNYGFSHYGCDLSLVLGRPSGQNLPPSPINIYDGKGGFCI